MYKEDTTAIQLVIEDYFNGIFYGDTEKLKTVFHPSALLFGDINKKPYFKTLDDYLEGVRNRKSPHALEEKFRMKIIAIEILGNIANVKLNVPMFEFNYYDFLAFNKVDGKWLVINKLFTHIPIIE
jgi:hypothetical protein